MSEMDKLTDEAWAVLEKWQSAMDDEILKGLQKATHADSVDTDQVVLEVTYADVQTLLAHRRASQAAPAPSDGLREAWIAGRDAAAAEAFYACGCKDSIEALTPPAQEVKP